jgi:hypothetical protein
MKTIEGYGHEDTIFGCNLRRLGYRIKDIDNPVVHLGLNTTDKFPFKYRKCNQKPLSYLSKLRL